MTLHHANNLGPCSPILKIPTIASSHNLVCTHLLLMAPTHMPLMASSSKIGT